MTTTTTTTTGASRQQQCSRRRICERQFSESFEILDFESFFASWSLDETVAIFGHLNAHPKENVGERDREDAVNNNNCEKVSTTSTAVHFVNSQTRSPKVNILGIQQQKKKVKFGSALSGRSQLFC